MPIFMKMGDIQGESTDQDHKNWILVESASTPVHRSIPPGAKDNQRSQGSTTLGDFVAVRNVDKSSAKIHEATANGKFFDTVELHLCNVINGKANPYLQYKLTNAVLTGYSFHGNSNADPLPTEEVSLNYEKIEITHTAFGPDGKSKGNTVGKYEPGKHGS
jgi:type VI secretion system secreted protein Hcp